MRKLVKYAAAATLTGALALALATPSQARHGHNAATIGFAAGALTGAAIAGANGGYYYGPGYYYGRRTMVRRLARPTAATAGSIITPADPVATVVGRSSQKRGSTRKRAGHGARLFSFRASSLEPRETVERALQDIGGGVLVDDGSAFLAADVGGNQLTLDRGA